MDLVTLGRSGKQQSKSAESRSEPLWASTSPPERSSRLANDSYPPLVGTHCSRCYSVTAENLFVCLVVLFAAEAMFEFHRPLSVSLSVCRGALLTSVLKKIMLDLLKEQTEAHLGHWLIQGTNIRRWRAWWEHEGRLRSALAAAFWMIPPSRSTLALTFNSEFVYYYLNPGMAGLEEEVMHLAPAGQMCSNSHLSLLSFYPPGLAMYEQLWRHRRPSVTATVSSQASSLSSSLLRDSPLSSSSVCSSPLILILFSFLSVLWFSF